MDGGDWGLLLLGGLAWALINQWRDTRIRFRCGARQGTFGVCREPVGGPGMRCGKHVSRRRRSPGP